MQQRLMCPGCRKVINEVPMLFNAPAVQLLNAYFQKNPKEEKRLEGEYKEISNEEFNRRCETILQISTSCTYIS